MADEYFSASRADWCALCKCFIQPHGNAKRMHEQSEKHKKNVEQKLKDIRQNEVNEKKDSDKLKKEMAEIEAKIRGLDRQATRERLQSDAEHVWGGRAKENAAPKVFRLVGVSAESVRAVADQVSSEVTSVEERVSLNMWANASLH